jgi:hypothetical protein
LVNTLGDSAGFGPTNGPFGTHNVPVSAAKSWREMHEWSAQLLERQTGAGVGEWSRRIRETGIDSRDSLQTWLKERDINGYAQQLLIMERFGYPEFLVASAEELIDGQYADRPVLRPILDRVLELAIGLAAPGDIEVQARKSYVTLRTRRRKFAVIKATTKKRVDLGLRIGGREPGGRLAPATVLRDDVLTVRIPLGSVDEVDGEVGQLLAIAFRDNQ